VFAASILKMHAARNFGSQSINATVPNPTRQETNLRRHRHEISRNKWHNHILRMESSRLSKKVKNYTNKTDEEMLEDREKVGRIVFGTEQANESLF
jgi:hypothetical protein